LVAVGKEGGNGGIDSRSETICTKRERVEVSERS